MTVREVIGREGWESLEVEKIRVREGIFREEYGSRRGKGK